MSVAVKKFLARQYDKILLYSFEVDIKQISPQTIVFFGDFCMQRMIDTWNSGLDGF